MAASLAHKPRKSQLSLKKKLSLPVNALRGRYSVSSGNPGRRQELPETQDDEQGEISLRWATSVCRACCTRTYAVAIINFGCVRAINIAAIRMFIIIKFV